MLKIQESSLDWALAHALTFGDTDVLPLPFEYAAIKHDWDSVRTYLAEQNLLKWNTRPHRMLLSPKAKYGFRVVTQLDPLDFILFAALVKEIGADIESRRIPTSRNVVYSYRFAPTIDSQIFNPTIGYSEFKSASGAFLDAQAEITHVAIADIADFYPRIYHHRLENALQTAVSSSAHVRAVMCMLKGWNETETFGIPVGNAPSRLLAECAISDVDDALLAAGIGYVRFNDDYRIFATSHAEAYRHIAFLADLLFRNHGLTLQSQKTRVVTTETFRSKFLPTLLDREGASLRERFQDLVDRLGFAYPYATITYEDLDEEQQALVDSVNLAELFEEEVTSKLEPDLPMIRFILGRLGSLRDRAVLDFATDNLDSLYPAFPDVIRYIIRLRGTLTEQERDAVGARVMALLGTSIVSQLDYHKVWALELFARSREWDHSDECFRLLGTTSEPSIRRQLILAIGRAGHRHWFQSQWRTLFDESHWPRRAVIAGASCMAPDARNHWYRSVEPRLDVLEKAVMRWASRYPF